MGSIQPEESEEFGEPEGDPTVENPVLDMEVERLDKLKRIKEAKVLRNKLARGIKFSKNIHDVIDALTDCGKESVAENIADVMVASEKLRGVDLENILASKDLFAGPSYDVGDKYLNKKIRARLIEFMREGSK